MDLAEVHRRQQESMAWSPGQVIVNATGAKVPRHRLEPPVPVVARIVWEQDGKEHVETVALGWTGQTCTCGLRTGGTGSRPLA